MAYWDIHVDGRCGDSPLGLVKLLLTIASWPWEVLASLATIGVLTLFRQVYQIFSYMDEAKKIHEEVKNLPAQMESLRSDLTAFTARFDDIVKFAANAAKDALQRQRETLDIQPELARLFSLAKS